MNDHYTTIIANKNCIEVYDFSLSDKAEVILLDFDNMDFDEKYVKAVDYHADLVIDECPDTVSYFIENGILAVVL